MTRAPDRIIGVFNLVKLKEAAEGRDNYDSKRQIKKVQETTGFDDNGNENNDNDDSSLPAAATLACPGLDLMGSGILTNNMHSGNNSGNNPFASINQNNNSNFEFGSPSQFWHGSNSNNDMHDINHHLGDLLNGVNQNHDIMASPQSGVSSSGTSH